MAGASTAVRETPPQTDGRETAPDLADVASPDDSAPTVDAFASHVA
jgi:hypothetical protein